MVSCRRGLVGLSSPVRVDALVESLVSEEDADAEGGDTDIDDGADVEEDPIQVELTPLELQIEEEGVNMVTHE